jgi:hypothetical protein
VTNCSWLYFFGKLEAGLNRFAAARNRSERSRNPGKVEYALEIEVKYQTEALEQGLSPA